MLPFPLALASGTTHHRPVHTLSRKPITNFRRCSSHLLATVAYAPQSLHWLLPATFGNSSRIENIRPLTDAEIADATTCNWRETRFRSKQMCCGDRCQGIWGRQAPSRVRLITNHRDIALTESDRTTSLTATRRQEERNVRFCGQASLFTNLSNFFQTPLRPSMTV